VIAAILVTTINDHSDSYDHMVINDSPEIVTIFAVKNIPECNA